MTELEPLPGFLAVPGPGPYLLENLDVPRLDEGIEDPVHSGV